MEIELKFNLKIFLIFGLSLCAVMWIITYFSMTIALAPLYESVDSIEKSIKAFKHNLTILTAQVSFIQQDISKRTIIHEKYKEIPPELYRYPQI